MRSFLRSSANDLDNVETRVRFIPTRVHGIADLIVGLVVTVLPFIYGWIGAQRWTFVALGLFVFVYSLFTDYEIGLVQFFRIRFHLFLDTIFAFLMLGLPWILKFSRDSLPPALAIGFLALALVATTKIRAEGSANHQPKEVS